MKISARLFSHTFLLLCFPLFAFAEMPSWLKVTPHAKSTAPVFVLGGADFSFYESFEMSMGIGQTPETYSKLVGEASAKVSGEDSVKNVVEDAFRGNSLFRLGMKYRFSGRRTGWSVGAGSSRLQARGQTDLQSTLGPSLHRDFSILIQALANTGRGSAIDISSTLDIYDVTVGYRWEIASDWAVDMELGYARVYAAAIKLNSNLPNYENSLYGSTQMRDSESDISKLLLENGMSPIFGLQISYLF